MEGDTPNNREEQWVSLLSSLKDDLALQLFKGYLKKVAAVIMSLKDVGFSLEKETDDFLSLQLKLLKGSQLLSTLYYDEERKSRKEQLLEMISQNLAFIITVVNMNCSYMEVHGSSAGVYLQQPAICLMKMVEESLTKAIELRKMLVQRHHFEDIINRLNFLSIDLLSEENVFTQAIWINFLLLYKCAGEVSIGILQEPDQCLEAICPYTHAPDIELRIIAKALLIALAGRIHNLSYSDSCPLNGSEAKYIATILNTDLPVPNSFHGLTYQDLFSMIKDLIECSESMSELLKQDLPSVLATQIDILPEKEQSIAAELLCLLMDNSNRLDKKFDDTELKCHDGMLPNEYVIVLPQENDVIFELCDLLLQYIVCTVLPLDGLPYKEIGEKVDSWHTIAAAISLIATLYSESDDRLQKELIRNVDMTQGSCEALYLAFYTPFLCNENSRSLMESKFRDLLLILMIWTDGSPLLAYKVAKSGLLFFPTTAIHVGRVIYTWQKSTDRPIKMALNILFNCALNPENSPAFRYCDVIPELLLYTKSTILDYAITSKFILYCLSSQLDYNHILALKLEEREAKYCITTLSEAMQPPQFSAEGFSLCEILEILNKLTRPTLTYEKPQSDAANIQQRKHQVLSKFEQKMNEARNELKANFSLLTKFKLLNLIESLLLISDNCVQELSVVLLWNVLHIETVKDEVLTQFPGIIENVLKFCDGSMSHTEQVADCVLLLLDPEDCQDHVRLLKYAQMCYQYRNFQEATSVCSNIIKRINSESDLYSQCILLQGKATFYGYQNKVLYMTKKRQSLERVEQKLLDDECFGDIKETITLLGWALDHFCLDEEGSKLLDWAMMDCLHETNRLNICRRCLLCRQVRDLCRSHLWPEFLIRDATADLVGEEEKKAQVLVFGLDKYRMKSAGECWFWMLCRKCEESLSQNSEKDFAQKFHQIHPKDEEGKVVYSTWFFHFCCAVIFRTLPHAKFPMRFNDDEVYATFVYCRKHLLSLPVKMEKQDVPLTKLELYQLQEFMQDTVCNKLKPFFFVTPSKMVFEIGNSGDYVNLSGLISINCLAVFRLIDGYRDPSGHAHFFSASFRNYHILVCFTPSSRCSIPDACLVLPRDGVYLVPHNAKKIQNIPKGHWMVFHRGILHATDTGSEISKNLSSKAAKKLLKRREKDEDTASPHSQTVFWPSSIAKTMMEYFGDKELLTAPFIQTTTKPLISLMPPQFDIANSDSTLNQCINFPQGHQVLLHKISEGENGAVLTAFLLVSTDDALNPFPSWQPYILVSHSNQNAIYRDAAFIETVNGRICFSNFLLENDYCSSVRTTYQFIYEWANDLIQLCMVEKGIYSIQILIQWLKVHTFTKLKGDLPPLDSKCSEDGCWYCKDRCHYCLKEACGWSKAKTKFTDVPYKFCSTMCLGMFCLAPSALEKNIFVTDHREDVKRLSPSILDILRINRNDGDSYNTIDCFNLCLADGSEADLSPGQLYVLWVSHHVHSKHFKFFAVLVTEKAEILGCLTTDLINISSMATEEIMMSYFQLQPVLDNIFSLVIKALGCKDLPEYIEVVQGK